jgi:acetyltransferase-like isoleucine patch superfamily enzyme
MIIVGTGGLGKEVLSILMKDQYAGPIVFYDENPGVAELIFEKFKVITKEDELITYIKNTDPQFVIGIGQPRIRERLSEKLKSLGGEFSQVISQQSAISILNKYPPGTIIEPFCGISHGLEMGEGCALHVHCSIGHAARIGKFVNVGPGAAVIGPIEIGDYSYIGAHAVLVKMLLLEQDVL